MSLDLMGPGPLRDGWGRGRSRRWSHRRPARSGAVAPIRRGSSSSP